MKRIVVTLFVLFFISPAVIAADPFLEPFATAQYVDLKGDIGDGVASMKEDLFGSSKVNVFVSGLPDAAQTYSILLVDSPGKTLDMGVFQENLFGFYEHIATVPISLSDYETILILHESAPVLRGTFGETRGG